MLLLYVQFHPLTIYNEPKQTQKNILNCMKNIYIIHDISSFLQDVFLLSHDLNVWYLKSKKNKSLNQRDQPKELNINFTVKSQHVT